MKANSFNAEVKQNLEFDEDEPEGDNDFEDDESEDDNKDEEQTSNGSSTLYSTPKRSKSFISFNDKKKAVDYWQSEIKKPYKISAVQKNFSFVTSIQQIYEWKKQIEEKGDRISKLKLIKEHTLNEFKNAKRRHLTVHDYDLRRWALNKQKELKINGFNASRNWIWKFKVANRIRSRKITKFITHNYSQENNNINETANLFVNSCESYFQHYEKSQIFNIDRSGFNLEIHSGRSLEFIGVKKVENVVQSIPSTTHSYSIQVCISSD